MVGHKADLQDPKMTSWPGLIDSRNMENHLLKPEKVGHLWQPNEGLFEEPGSFNMAVLAAILMFLSMMFKLYIQGAKAEIYRLHAGKTKQIIWKIQDHMWILLPAWQVAKHGNIRGHYITIPNKALLWGKSLKFLP